MEEASFKENRIRALTNLYYSNPKVQKTIFDFCQNRETVPRYFEGFGKRPDSLQYPGDIFELVKKGATSFHCSEEIWKDPLKISTNMNEQQFDELREGWDFLIDIDSKYIDYSKVMAKLIAKFFKFHGVKNFGIKFSGSKGFHMIIPWNAFPKDINGVQTSAMFPEWPRIIVKYIIANIEKELVDNISQIEKSNKYIKDFQASKEVIPDLILVSPRHLFRAPYSLHEKTALASVVLDLEKIDKFDLKDADPMKAEIKSFYPNAKEGEAKELLLQALDWHKQTRPEKEEVKKSDFKPIKIEKFSEDYLSPSIKKILEGVSDGKKRSLFILINLFRSIGMEKDELEERISNWNKKNKPPLREGYVQSQLVWSYRNKIVLPPNFDKDYYKAIGIDPTDEELRLKNPVNYVLKKVSKNPKIKDNFKNKR
ncbi:MAG: DNA primase small subunit domain-containing protein [Nanoarchaeota archaeon]